MFVSGWSTLLQTLFGSRLPAVVGVSPQYMIPISFMSFYNTFSTIEDPREKFVNAMRAIQGAHIISSIFQIVIGFSGLWRAILMLLSPLSAVPLLSSLGLGFYKFSFSQLGTCFEIGIPMLVMLITISVYLPRLDARRRHIYERFGFFISIGIVWVYTVILNYSGFFDKSPIARKTSCQAGRSALIKASWWFKIPYPFQWGRPTFNIGAICVMIAGVIVSTVESTGTLLTIERYSGATHIPPSILSRGIGWQGAGLLLNGVFGTALGSAPSNLSAGLIGWTRVGSRRVVQIAGIFMIVFSMFGKFQAVIASVPSPIVLSVSCLCYGCGTFGGIGLLQHCNLNSSRTKLILGWSLFFAFSIPYFLREQVMKSASYQDETAALVVKDMFMTIFLSEATVGVIVAFFLDCTLAFNNPMVQQQSGFYWWARFANYNNNLESQEDYALPFGLDAWFPPL